MLETWQGAGVVSKDVDHLVDLLLVLGDEQLGT